MLTTTLNFATLLTNRQYDMFGAQNRSKDDKSSNLVGMLTTTKPFADHNLLYFATLLRIKFTH